MPNQIRMRECRLVCVERLLLVKIGDGVGHADGLRVG